MTDFHVIIPARYQSGRLPGKSLMDIAGKPMIQHVVECCNSSAALGVTVATDDQRIVDAVESFNGNAVMTSGSHQSGSDRIAEAAKSLGLQDDDIVVNVQGDEPDMPAGLIDQVADALQSDFNAEMATAYAALDSVEQLNDPSVVKVVTNSSSHAIYFSRATIPWVRSETSAGLAENAVQHVRRHIGIYAYTSGYIQKFTQRGSCDLEDFEKLEQLRGIWHGDKIQCVEAVAIPGPGIDTPNDLECFRKLFDGRLTADG